MPPPLAPFIHQAFEYDSTAFFVSEMLPFVRSGLRNREPVYVIAASPNLAALKAALGPRQSRVDWRDAADHYVHPARTLAAYDRYVQEHRPPPDGHVRIVGETIWSGLKPDEIEEWTLYEAALNVAFAQEPVWMVCPYDVRSLDASIVANAHRTHPQLARTGGSCASQHYVHGGALHEEYRDRPARAESGTAVAEMTFNTLRLRAVRTLVERHALEAGIAHERVYQLVLAVMEAISNVVKHAGGEGGLRITLCEDALTCDVRDTGGGFSESLRGYIPPPCDALSGRGLWIIRQMCDSVQFLRGSGTSIVRMQMQRR